MSTIITKTIGTAAGRDYATMQLWEDDRSGDLVVRDTIEKGVCYNDSIFTGRIYFDGSNCDQTHYMWLTAADTCYHNGIEGAGVVVNSPSTVSPFMVCDYGTVVDSIEITNWGQSGNLKAAIYIDAAMCSVHHCLIHDEANGNNGKGIEYCTSYNKIYRNIIYETGVATCKIGIWDSNGWMPENLIYNNTVHNLVDYCIKKVTGGENTIIKNNCCTNAGVACFDTPSLLEASNNLSSDATAPGVNSLINKAASNQYVSIVSPYNLHLKAGADCINSGINLGASYDKDIDKETVTGIWDIGADEYIVAVVVKFRRTFSQLGARAGQRQLIGV